MSPDPAPPEAATPPSPSPAATGHPEPPAPVPAGHHGPGHTHCENCGTALLGPWCHHCGQHDFEFHRSFWHVFLEALETLFHFEGKFFRNIVTLLFQPGRLTADFNAGRRASQMPPFRLYIFVSFVFFLLIFLGNENAFIRETKPATPGLSINGRPVYPASSEGPDATAPAPPAPHVVDQLQAAAEEIRQANTAKSGRADRSELAEFLGDRARRAFLPENRVRLSESFQHHLPHMLMLCLPLFALYTRLLFRRSGLVYLQHLVLALHFHTFIYLWVLCRNGWASLAGLPGWGLDAAVAIACNLWLFAYPVLMLRRLFANPWPRTLVKTFVLALGYGFTLGIGFLLTAVLLFVTL
jgi:hypothetical protein